MSGRFRRVTPCVAVACLVGACDANDAAPAGRDTIEATTSAPASTNDTTNPATTVATSDGVTVMGVWSGPELASFTTVAEVWELEQSATVTWRGARDLASELSAALAKGDAPDIVVLPNPGLLHELADDGVLVPLGSVLDLDDLRSDYGDAWLELGSHDGEAFGIPYKVTDKSAIWYDPAGFDAAGYEIPATWDDLTALAGRMASDGTTPFSVVAPDSPGAGWALTDWVSQLVLSGCGTDVYDSWVAGETSWTDPCIDDAFRRFDDVVQTDGWVLGGVDGIERTTDAEGSYPMFTDPPTAQMYYMASFAQAFIAQRFPEQVPGQDYGVFPFPAVDADQAGTAMIGADIVVMLHDTPAARSFLAYLEGPEAQEVWIDLGGFTSVHREVGLDRYPDPVSRAFAEQLTSATAVRYAAGDLMPFDLQRTWWDAMMTLLREPERRPEILADLDAAADRAG